jgi:hypothetical protein
MAGAKVTLTGGAKLSAHLKRIAKEVSRPASLSVGFLAGSTYPDGTPTAAVAAWNEWGTPTIPSRPFFRRMIRLDSSKWGVNVGQALKIADYDVSRALSFMGVEIKEELQDSIRSGDFAPLSPVTVAAKGFDQPLIDTSHMINSVDYRVDQGA